MDMHKDIEQLGAQHAGEKVGLRKAKNHDAENKQRHCGKKNVVGAQLLRGRHCGGHNLAAFLAPAHSGCHDGNESSMDLARSKKQPQVSSRQRGSTPDLFE
jgi:hypothetical protein